MVIFRLVWVGREMFSIGVEAGRRAEEEMFSLLDGHVGYETAIEASSWCDIATVGEVFRHEKFTITCEEL